MDKETYWQALCARNPKLRDDEHTMVLKARNLKALIFQGMDLAAREDQGEGKAPDPFDIFNDILGKK